MNFSDYNAEQTKGKALCEAARPSWAKAVIVAHCAVDKSDIQTDYFHVQDGPFHVLAWSRHDKDRFDEMRKAAARFLQTAHLGPGCDEYTARVVFENDIKGNGIYYNAGNGSPWHRELYDKHGNPPVFTTEKEAQAYITLKGEPGEVRCGDQVARFKWDIWKQPVEHREKWSMGAGYYLRAGHSGGWTVEKTTLTDSAVYAAFAAGRVHLDAPKPQANTKEDIRAEIARLRAENEALRAQAAK